MEPRFDEETEAFRQEVRDFLRDSLPDEIRRWCDVATVYSEFVPLEIRKRWARILYERGGWTCPGLPREHGGAGLSPLQCYVLARELSLAGAAHLPEIGADLVAPTLVAFGTEEQRERFLPGILTFDDVWCQGFSEPGAGSDLAALECRAERQGDEYVLDGTKIWTSYAHCADWMIGLFRTDRSGKKQQGITVLCVPMSAAGVTVVPIVTFAGTHILNQVLFSRVRVPAENRLGEEGDGWGLVKHVLALERTTSGLVPHAVAALERLKEVASRQPAGEGSLLEETAFGLRIAELELSLRALELTELRLLLGSGDARAQAGVASLVKLRWSEIHSELTELLHQACGYRGHADLGAELDVGGPEPGLLAEAARAAVDTFNARSGLIYGGSSEIQRNIIAKAVLGLS
ncbi:MAG: acyl-CoA dehydrogenase family protein [Thermoleophilia bacterium]|nr:acyl-CoA dehydrogenase family protein [Thermoleophilia bacterium]